MVVTATPAFPDAERERELELVHRCIEGDAEALRRMCEENAKAVRRVVALLGPQSIDRGDDLVQDTFVRALQALPRFRGQAPLGVWLRGVALNLARTERNRERRRKRLRASLPRPADEPPPDGQVESRAALRRLRVLLDRLTPEEREAFVLRRVEHLSVKEVATLTRTAESTVSDRAERARIKLSRWLEDDA